MSAITGLRFASRPCTRRRVSFDRDRCIPAPFERSDQLAAANALGIGINEIGKRLRVDGTRPPIPHHHGDCRAATQRFALREKRDVEQRSG